MNFKTTYILFGLLVVVLVAFAAYQLWGDHSDTKGPSADYLFADFNRGKDPIKSDEIESIRVERSSGGKNETLVFKRGKGGWEMTEPYALRTDNYQVDNLLRQVTGAQREKSEMSKNLAEYGLDDPKTVVTLRKGDQEWKLNIGNQSPGSGGVIYASNAAKPKEPAAVRKNGLDAVFKNVNDFRSRELLSATTANTSSIQLNAGDKDLSLEKTSDGLWRFVKPAYGPANLEGETSAVPPAVGDKKVTGVRDLIDDAGGLRVEADNDFVADGVSDADLAAKYGLGDKPETLRIQTKSKPLSGEEKTETLLVGKKAPKEEKKDDKKDEKKDEKKPEEKVDYYYVRLEGEKSVERVPAAKVKPLLDVMGNLDVLRNRDLVTVPSTAKIDAIDVKSGNNALKLRQVDNKWTLYHDGARGTDDSAVRELMEALTGDNPLLHKKTPLVKTFVDKEDGLEFDKPAAVVSLWLDGIKKEEKKEEKKEDKKEEKKEEKKDDKEPELKSATPTVTLTFGKRDSDKDIVYVRRESGGDTSIVTVSAGLLDKVKASPLAYMDRKLPSFSSDPFDPTRDVTRLSLRRGGQTWEVSKEKSGDKTVWKFTQPQAMAGRSVNEIGVGDVLRDLSSLRADKIVDEKPSETNLDQLYGLKSPEVKAIATVKKDDKTEEWVYSFGKQSDTKMGVYTKLNRNDLVYLVPKTVVDRLESAELRDLTVLSFDMNKVKGAKITVWSNDLKTPVTLELERKGDKDWTKKAGLIEPDNTKVENFISGLSHLRATRFVTPKPGTDTGLDVSKKALKVEILTDSGPLDLVVGNEDPENKGQLFASSSKLPNEVFLVPEGMFKEAKSSPSYLSK
jgi:hypothetical protein